MDCRHAHRRFAQCLVLNGWAMQDLTDAARRTGRATDQYTAALDQLLNFLKGLAARPDGDDRA